MKIGKIRTEDFILQLSRSGNYYIVDPETGQNVMVAKTVAERWDDLDTVTVGERKFTKQTDNNPDSPTHGQLIDKDWSRMEIVGKGSVSATYGKKTRNLKAVVEYQKVKKELLEAEELSAEAKQEIEAALAV